MKSKDTRKRHHFKALQRVDRVDGWQVDKTGKIDQIVSNHDTTAVMGQDDSALSDDT